MAKYYDSYESSSLVLNQWGLYQAVLVKDIDASQSPVVLLSNGCCNEVVDVIPQVSEDERELIFIIPNRLLEDWGALSVYIETTSIDPDTEQIVTSIVLDSIKIPIRPRPRPGDYYDIIEETERPFGVLRLNVGRLDLNVLGDDGSNSNI